MGLNNLMPMLGASMLFMSVGSLTVGPFSGMLCLIIEMLVWLITVLLQHYDEYRNILFFSIGQNSNKFVIYLTIRSQL